MKKRLISAILVMVMLLAMLPVSGAAAGVTTYKIGVAIYAYNDNFMTLYRQELESYFASLETDTIQYDVTIVNGNNDYATQLAQVDTFIEQGMDAIILNLVWTSAADTLIDKVAAADIPLVLINREPLAYDAEGNSLEEAYPGIVNNPNVCYVGADARQVGTYQGEIVAALDNHGDMDGDGVVRYVMIVGDPENPDAQYRTEYSIKALTDAGIEVECLDQQIGNWDTSKGNEIAANALAKSGDKIDVIFCNNDGMALGASVSIQAAGRKVGEDILLVGADALEACQEMVRHGDMTGTVLNDHVAQSHVAADVTVRALNGEKLYNYYWVDYTKIDADYFKPKVEFTDIPEQAYYREPVQWAIEKGITNGMGNNTFAPAMTCNRAQVVTFLWRAAGSPAPESSENPFVDVPDGQFYTDAVLWAVEEGITSGADAYHFNPSGACSRAQVVTFLHRAAGSPAPASSKNSFEDVPDGQFYTNAVLWAVERGITNGVDGAHFAPNATCDRAQIVTFLYRAYT